MTELKRFIISTLFIVTIGAGAHQNSGASALAGALGGMGAEMMAEALPQTWDPQIRGNAAILGLSAAFPLA